MRVEKLMLAHMVDGMWHVSLEYYLCNVNNKILFLSRWYSLGSRILVGLHLDEYGTMHLLCSKTTKKERNCPWHFQHASAKTMSFHTNISFSYEYAVNCKEVIYMQKHVATQFIKHMYKIHTLITTSLLHKFCLCNRLLHTAHRCFIAISRYFLWHVWFYKARYNLLHILSNRWC